MLFALLAKCRRSPTGRLGPRQGVLSSSSHRSGRASHAARELGAGEDVVAAYQARAAVRQKRACPDDAPRRARVPEGEASAGSEPAPGTVPPLTAAGTADAARPAPPTPPTPPTRATLAFAPPVNPGCPTRLLVTGDPVAAVVPPGVMAAFPTARTCICLARLPCWFSLPAHPRRRHQSPDATR